MGYRSNVVIYIEETENIKLEQIIRGAFIANDEYGSDNCEIGKNSDGKRVLCVEYTDYKWYEGYAIVEYWENIFEQLDYEHYLFTREGEDWDDIEIKGEYGKAYVTSDIEYYVDFEK